MEIIEQSKQINLEAFLKKPLFAHLATEYNGRAFDSPIWCLWQSEKLYICTDIINDSFGKRIHENGQCAIGVVDYDASIGKLHHVGFRGEAKVVAFNKKIAQQIFAKYLGKDIENWPAWFQQFLDNSNARLIEFVPETVIIRDGSYKKPN